MAPSDNERISMIRSAVLIQSTRVTDGQRDRRTGGIAVAYTRCSMLSRVINVKRGEEEEGRKEGGPVKSV